MPLHKFNVDSEIFDVKLWDMVVLLLFSLVFIFNHVYLETKYGNLFSAFAAKSSEKIKDKKEQNLQVPLSVAGKKIPASWFGQSFPLPACLILLELTRSGRGLLLVLLSF